MITKIRNKTSVKNSPNTNIINGDDNSIHNYFNTYEDGIIFTKESKDFLKNFSNLKGYIFNKIFKFKDKYTLKTDYEIFASNVFEWIFGDEFFPSSEYKTLLCNKTKQDIYNKRRECLNDYFTNTFLPFTMLIPFWGALRR